VCDRYLEMIKRITNDDKRNPEQDAEFKSCLATLFTCLDHGLRALHPIMPFVTEELYHRLPDQPHFSADEIKRDRKKSGSIMVQPYPDTAVFSGWRSQEIEQYLAFFDNMGKSCRSVRQKLGITKQRIPLYVQTSAKKIESLVNQYAADIATLTVCTPVRTCSKQPLGCVNAESVVFAGETVNLFLAVAEGGVDPVPQIVRMETSQESLTEAIADLLLLQSDVAKVARMPEDVKKKNAESLMAKRTELQALEAGIVELHRLLNDDQKRSYLRSKVDAAKVEMTRQHDQLAKTRFKAAGKRTEQEVTAKITMLLELEATLAWFEHKLAAGDLKHERQSFLV